MRLSTVLVVGAGPTGLTLAAVLAQQGVELRLVDRHAAPQELTKSAALHARTLEQLDAVGVGQRVLAEGQRVDRLTLRTAYRDRVTVDFRTLTDTRVPHMVDIPQYRTERLLLERLAELGVAPDREVSLTGLAQDATGVRANLRRADGTTETVLADWVVGCDGARSTTRTLTGIDFTGDEYADDWVLCDAVVDWPLPRNEMTFSADARGIYGVFPLPGERRYRLAYTQNRAADGSLVPPDLADAQATLPRTGITGRIESVDQFWTFNLAHRQAASYRRGRVFLAGDAGHVHTPFGGQGLNLGVGDAVNLGWKLAAVARGQAPTTLLDSYDEERHRVGREVIALTHLGASAMLLRADRRRHLRDAVMSLAQATPPARRLLARRLSQLSHSYRGTGTVTGRHRGVRGGDRLPDHELFDGATDRSLRLHDLLARDRHTLLLTSREAGSLERAATEAAAVLGRRWGARWDGALARRLVSPDWRLLAGSTSADAGARLVLDRGGDAADLYGRRPAALLVRPDGHVGYAGPADPEALDGYLRLVLATPEAGVAGPTT